MKKMKGKANAAVATTIFKTLLEKRR